MEKLRVSMFVDFGFNRYMVECEYFGFLLNEKELESFNRYMVECE